MLTQDQINKLKPFTQHPRYGKLLEDAIESWKFLNPISNDFGISPFSEKTVLCPRGEACLIGASIVGKEFKEQLYVKTVEYYFDISEHEIWSLIEGFDNCKSGTHAQIPIVQAYQFGQIIRNIINPKFND